MSISYIVHGLHTRREFWHGDCKAEAIAQAKTISSQENEAIVIKFYNDKPLNFRVGASFVAGQVDHLDWLHPIDKSEFEAM
jgi:hypothetical protein